MNWFKVILASLSFALSAPFAQSYGDRSLGQQCHISASVQCFVGVDLNKSCSDLRANDPCGVFDMTFVFRYCNVMDGKDATIREDRIVVKMADQVYHKEDINDHSTLPSNACHSLTKSLTIDSCNGRKQVPASVKFEGWVTGFEYEDGYYCYAWSFMKVQLPRLIPSPAPSAAITNTPTQELTFEPSLKPVRTESSEPTFKPSHKPTNDVGSARPSVNPMASSSNPVHVFPPVPDPSINMRAECVGEPDGFIDSGKFLVPCQYLRTPNDSNASVCLRNIKFIFSVDNDSDEDMEIQSFISGREDSSYDELVDANETLLLYRRGTYALEYVVNYDICRDQNLQIHAFVNAIGVNSGLSVSKDDDYVFLVR
jgi:hypothetical protein